MTGTQFWLIFIMIFYDDAAGEKRSAADRECIGSARGAICFYHATLYLYNICTAYQYKKIKTDEMKTRQNESKGK